MIRLRRLKAGDRVALVAPASSFPPEEVPAGVAESDAEGIEHHVSRETLAAFVRHLERKAPNGNG